jgi:hypothetical protein
MTTCTELLTMLQQIPPPPTVSYRLYHDDQGRPLYYSMEHRSGTYIEIDQPTYARSSPWVRVRDSKLHIYEPWSVVQKLRPADQGTACCVEDVAIVVTHGPYQRWSRQQHDQD